MKEAFYFVEDFNRLARDLGTNFVANESALKNFRGRWGNRATKIEFNAGKTESDPSEVYSFEDGSIAYLTNPNQHFFPACAYVDIH